MQAGAAPRLAQTMDRGAKAGAAPRLAQTMDRGGKGRCSATFSLDNGQGGKALFTHNACPPNFIVQFSSVHLFHFQHINIVKRIYQAGNQYKHINYNTKIITVSHIAGLHTNFFSWWPDRATKIINYHFLVAQTGNLVARKKPHWVPYYDTKNKCQVFVFSIENE